MPSLRRFISLFILLLLRVSVTPALGANTSREHPPIALGTSGGSAADLSATACCSGTLGSLVKRDGVACVLSNNHVLARSGSAVAGERIIQPGLADNNCGAAGTNVVATFPGDLVPLGHNVDTALGTVIPGEVNPSGTILGIGVPCSSTAAPAVGLKVIKTGRTTGTTTGKVQAVNVRGIVQYQTQCNAGSTFDESYTNQVVISPGSFSASGDSGSLILSNTSSGNRHPVALLFAGNSSLTLANPISAVVAAYEAGGHTFSFVGKACSTKDDLLLSGPSPADVEFARQIKEEHEAELFAQNGVVGVGVGKVTDIDDEREPAIIVYVLMNGRSVPRDLALPAELEGVKVRVIPTEPFVAR